MPISTAYYDLTSKWKNTPATVNDDENNDDDDDDDNDDDGCGDGDEKVGQSSLGEMGKRCPIKHGADNVLWEKCRTCRVHATSVLHLVIQIEVVFLLFLTEQTLKEKRTTTQVRDWKLKGGNMVAKNKHICYTELVVEVGWMVWLFHG